MKEDAVFGVEADFIADFRNIDDPQQAAEFGMPNPFKIMEWNFKLARADRE